MALLYKNNCFSPFMGDNRPISVGLNPLGIRTASEQLFTTLLPGLNVVTLRIRYYSFYCWLLKSFYEHRTEAKRLDFQCHIRMSELLMALIHAYSNNNAGIPGIIRALEIVGREDEIINFRENAIPNGDPEKRYWKGPSGAFGSYYAASLQEMGLIRPLIDNPSLYNITLKTEEYISGEKLADAFSKSIGNDMCKLFLDCANTGKVTRQQLAVLEPAFQSHNLPDNQEREILLQMLLQNDRPSSHIESRLRYNSLCLLLSYINDTQLSGFSDLDFAKYVYDSYKNGERTSLAAAGWYAYYLNDSRQYEALLIFDVILNRLQKSTKPGQWENLDEFTTQLSSEVCKALNVEQNTLQELFDNWNSITEPEEQMAHAFYIILDNYRSNSNYKNCKSIIRTSFHNVSNDALDAFDTIELSLNKPVNQFVKHFLTESIIYNHYSESMRKYSQNGILTQKLTIENGYVRGLDVYYATHSSPRIDTLRNFAIDLGLINHNRITDRGKELLNNIHND